MEEKKQVLFWVLASEKERLLELKGGKTWRELILPAVGIPYEPIPIGPPRSSEGVNE